MYIINKSLHDDQLYLLVNLTYIQTPEREICKGIFKNTVIQGEAFTQTLPMDPEIPRIIYTWIWDKNPFNNFNFNPFHPFNPLILLIHSIPKFFNPFFIPLITFVTLIILILLIPLKILIQ